MNRIVFTSGPDKSINWTIKDIELAIKKKDYNKKINDDTMLMHAVKTNDIELAEKLLKFKADTSLGDRQNRTPLWLCTIYNRPEIARLLIKNGASLEEVPGTNSPLYNAIKHDNNAVAIELINLGANVNCLNRDNQTPLHCAAFRNNIEMVKILLSNGADKNITNNVKPLIGELVLEERKPQTALDIAREKDYREIVKLLQTSNEPDNKAVNKTKLIPKEPIFEGIRSPFLTYLKEEAEVCFGLYYLILVVFAIGTLISSGGGILIAIGGILGIIALGSIISFFQETAKALKKYCAIVFIYWIGVAIIKMIIMVQVKLLGTPAIIIMLSHFLIETPLVMLVCFYAKHKNK